ELSDASQHGRVIHSEAFGGSPYWASARDGKKIANVIPVDHGAFRHRAVHLPKPVSNTSNPNMSGYHSLFRRTRPNSDQQIPIVAAGVRASSRIDFAPPMCALPHSTHDSGGPMW